MQRTSKNRPNKNITPKYYLRIGALVPSALLGAFPTDTEIGFVSQLSTKPSSIGTLVGFIQLRGGVRCSDLNLDDRTALTYHELVAILHY